MAVLTPVSCIDDTTMASHFTNPQYAIDAAPGTSALRGSGAGGRPKDAALIFDFGVDVELGSFAVAAEISGQNFMSGSNHVTHVQAGASSSGPWTTITGSSAGTHPNETWTRTGSAVAGRYVRIWYDDTKVGLSFIPWILFTNIAFDGSNAPLPPSPPDPQPIQIDIGGVRFTGLREQTVRVELNGSGSFFFAINRHDPQATEQNIYRSAIVEILIPQIHSDVLVEGIIETGDFDLLKTDEEGAEWLSFGGPGTLAILKRVTMDFTQYIGAGQEVFPSKGYWQWQSASGGNRTEGDIIKRIVEEADTPLRPGTPVPDIHKTFTNVHDTNDVNWADEPFVDWWRTPIGANAYDEIIKLANAGFVGVEMAPGLTMNAYRNFGRELTGDAFAVDTIRFVKGVNIVEDLSRSMLGASWATRAIVRYGDGDWTRAAISGTFPYEQEMFVESSATAQATARREAQGLMRLRVDAQEALLVSVLQPESDADPDWVEGADGTVKYLPGPQWSDNGQYWVGDLVTLHTGSGDFEYDNETQRIHAITITINEDTGELAVPIVELNAPYRRPGQDGDLIATGGPSAGTGGGSGGGGGGTAPHSHASYQPIADKNEPGGYAGLDDDGHLIQNVISPAQLTANTDNWNPTGLTSADIIRFSTDASRNITGIVAPTDGGRRLILQNVGAFNAVLKHDATSTAANRFYCPGSTDLTLGPNASVELVYDTTSDRWRVLDPAAGSGSSGITIKDEGTPLSTAATSLDFVGSGVVASGTTGDKTITISGAPTGSAGGDLSGTYPNPSVVDDSHAHTSATLPATDWGEDADISTLDYGDSPAGGASTEVARADHVHGMPSSGGGGGAIASAIDSTTSPSLSSEGDVAWDSDGEVLVINDGQRDRFLSEVGWMPWVFPMGWSPGGNGTTSITLPANGGSIAIAMPVTGHILLDKVRLNQRSTTLQRTWGWDLYVQDLNNGNSGENTLRRVAASSADQTFTASAVSNQEIQAASAPVYLGPGLYWLVIQNRHASNTFLVGSNPFGGAITPAPTQTKTTSNPNGSTLDFVAATWTKNASSMQVVLGCRVFGETVPFG